jgi:hypothetical protein
MHHDLWFHSITGRLRFGLFRNNVYNRTLVEWLAHLRCCGYGFYSQNIEYSEVYVDFLSSIIRIVGQHRFMSFLIHHS